MPDERNPLYEPQFQQFMDEFRAMPVKDPLAVALHAVCFYTETLLAGPEAVPTDEELRNLRPLFPNLLVHCLELRACLARRKDLPS